MDLETLLKNLNINNSNIFLNEPMKKYTSFKVGGPAECLIKVETQNEIQEVLKFVNKNKIPFTIVGNGTNILVSDNGIKGIVLKININNLKITELNNTIEIIVGAGFKLSILAQELLKKNISGFEELSGIPGTIGGAIKMNAGAHGREFKDIVENVKVMDYKGNIKNLNKKDLKFSYRHSIFLEENYIILEAKLRLEKGIKEQIKNKMNQYKSYRKEKQPIEYPSAGSTFKRGEDFITAKLIDEAGLKGYKIGDAEVSTKHAGFIINIGSATSKDILALIEYVKNTIKEKFKKEIELEIEVIGENNYKNKERGKQNERFI